MRQLVDNYFELIFLLVMIVIVLGVELRHDRLLPFSGLNSTPPEVIQPRFFYR
jgi:hypothetical protein